MTPIRLDYHLHTHLCGHAQGEMRAYVEAALAKGFNEIGFSDHLPLYHLPPERRDPSLAMRAEELPGYVETVLALAQEYAGRITIRLGIEADYIPGREAELAEWLTAYPFDYVYGSVHFLGDWAFDDPRYKEEYARREIDAVYRQYFQTVQAAAKSGLFDILAHLDLVKKFNFRPRGDISALLAETVAAVKEADLCLEVNSAGLRKPVGEIYPSQALLELCHAQGIPVTFGSDAHTPDQVGLDWEKAKALLQTAGYAEIASFRRRQRFLTPFA